MISHMGVEFRVDRPPNYEYDVQSSQFSAFQKVCGGPQSLGQRFSAKLVTAKAPATMVVLTGKVTSKAGFRNWVKR